MSIQPEFHLRYIDLFRDSLGVIRVILEGIFSTLLKKWGGGLILPFGSEQQDRIIEDSNNFELLCFYLREELRLPQFCIDCDKRMAQQAATYRKPIDYWCDWGLRDIAVPIMLHESCVGTILCGQKTLDEPEDREGENILLDFARKNKLEDRIPTLLEMRRQVGSVTFDEIREMKRILWATSQYISQILYSKLDHEQSERQQTSQVQLNKFFNSIYNVSRRSNTWRFWSDYEKILFDLSKLFDFRSAAILITQNRETKVVSSYKLSPKSKLIKGNIEEQLITSTMDEFVGPQHKIISASLKLSCPVCRDEIEKNHEINLVLFAKSNLGTDKIIHYIIFFDPSIERKNPFLLHEKKQILLQLILVTINIFTDLGQIENLKKLIKEKEQFLKDVAHQIRQPLHSIVAYCDNFLSPRFSQERKDRIPKHLFDRARHGSILIKCVEYAARGDENIFASETVNPIRYSLTTLLIESAITMRGYAGEEDVQIHVVEAKTDPLGLIMIDKNKFEIAITNILFNAVKYSFPKNKICISAEHGKNKNQIIVYIKNTGIGIPQDRWKKIFKRGIRSAEAVNYSQSGLGIGLFVTREIMLALGGDAYVVKSVPTGLTYKKYEEFENTIALSFKC